MSGETKIVNRISLPWAVAITIALTLIPGLFFGKWNFTLWVSFITWAEYFILGMKPEIGKFMIPCLLFGCFTAFVWCANWQLFETLFKTNYTSNFWTWVILSATNFIWIAGLVYAIEKVPLFGKAGLAVFNGLTLYLAVYFTYLGGAKNGFPQGVGPDNPYWILFWIFLWTFAMEVFGYLAAVFNIWIMFPKKVKA
jgi:hypothetical protein